MLLTVGSWVETQGFQSCVQVAIEGRQGGGQGSMWLPSI